MQKAYIISTGTELILGSTMDLNSVYLAEKLLAMGFKVVGKSVVGDSAEHIRSAFVLGLESADLVVSSGGMGPTRDDLSKEVACEVMHSPMETVEEEFKRLQDFFACRQRPLPEKDNKQAMFPRGAIILNNSHGSAPGMYLKKEAKAIALLPGPPHEMKAMYDHELEPLLRKEFNLESTLVMRRTIKVLGLGESQIEEKLKNLMDNAQGYNLALLAQDGEVHIKVTAEGNNLEHSKRLLENVTTEIEKVMGNDVFGRDGQTLASVVADLLKEKKYRLAVAESCTGGMLGKMITEMEGSSQYFWGGAITYSNEAKQLFLGVKEDTLKHYGAVSQEAAAEMAQGISLKSGTDFGLAITGIAGPQGGSEDKPVGLVYIALDDRHTTSTKKIRIVGNREAIRTLAAKSALDMLRHSLTKEVD